MKAASKPQTLIEEVPFSTQGIALDLPPESVKDGEHLVILNGLIRGGRITPRPAFTLLNTFTERIMAVGAFKSSSFEYTFVLTPTRLWRLSGSTWTEIKQLYTTGTISTTQGSTTVNGTGTQWLSGPDPVKAGDEITFNGETKVIASVASNTQLTLTAAAEQTYSGAYQIRMFLKGGVTDLFSWVVFRDRLYFVQGIDVVKVWDGGDTYTYEDVLSGQSYSCKYLTTWADRLILLHTKEDGVWQRRRMRWCARATPSGPLDWVGDGSGAVDLMVTQGYITGAKPFAGKLVIYKDDSISLAQETGQVAAPFDIAQSVVNVGCVAPFSLADVGSAHVFAGRDGIYIYDGGAPTLVTKKIDYGMTMLSLALEYCVGAYDPSTRSYWLLAGKTTDPSSKNLALIALDVRTGSWTLHLPWVGFLTSPTYGIDTIGIGPGRLKSYTIDELPGTIDSLPQPIDAAGELHGATALLLAREDGQLYVSDPQALSDYGAGNWNVAVFTKWLNFGLPHVHKTLKRAKARVELFGQPVEMELKVNGVSRTVQLNGDESTVVFDLWMTDYVFKPELYIRYGQFALDKLVFEAEERGWGQ